MKRFMLNGGLTIFWENNLNINSEKSLFLRFDLKNKLFLEDYFL